MPKRRGSRARPRARSAPDPHSAQSLGAGREIPRRDFLQGALLGAAGALAGQPWRSLVAAEAPPAAATEHYPPTRTGLRGAHPGSYEAAHAARDGAARAAAEDTRESYDLVVVGAGISGLAAAHFFKAGSVPQSRVLLLDNHDDFGGHAKRNEFSLDGRMQLLNGGTLEIDSPRPYSAVADGLLRELGVDVAALSRKVEHRDFYTRLGLQKAAFFDAETFGADRLILGVDKLPARRLFSAAPLSARAREDLARIEEGSGDVLPALSGTEKKQRLVGLSYRDYLRDLVRADAGALAYYQTITHGEWGVGIDAISALDAWAYGLPGFKGLKLPPGAVARMGPTPAGYLETGGSPVLHFPDGNASIARLLVRRLIPEAIPGSTAEDIVTAHADYARLDGPGTNVRLRLNSTVLDVRHDGDASSAREVLVTYVCAGHTRSVRAKHCVLACWNMMIPYLCPELPPPQRQALHSLVKTPLVYTSVALRNWRAFRALGIWRVYAPGSFYSTLWLNRNVDIGSYHTAERPERPTLVHLERTPCKPGLPEREQNKAGRAELLGMSFATFELETRRQLTRILAPGGFDAARDIEAITVNRWPHGYSPEYNPLFEPLLPPEQQAHVIGRARYGRISIANADAGASAYTDSAIDQAHRAVVEQLAL